MKRISLFLLITLTILLQSCIKEDLSTCNSELLLRFRYTLNDQHLNLFGSVVHQVTIYVFDSNGKYVERFSEQGTKLTNDYVMHVPLPEGKYQVVVYGGDFTTYSVGELNNQTHILNQTLRPGVTDIKDFRIELKNTAGADKYLYPTGTPDDLYAGLTVDAVSAPQNQTVTDVELMKDTKNIKVKITGTDVVGAPLDVYITALNGRYKYDNSIDLNHGTFKYTPINSSVQTNYTEVDLKMMRLLLGQSPMLVIQNSVTKEVIYNKNMIDQILQTHKYTTQEDFDREDEFVFEITLPPKGNHVGISVSINGWKIQIILPDM